MFLVKMRHININSWAIIKYCHNNFNNTFTTHAKVISILNNSNYTCNIRLYLETPNTRLSLSQW